MGGCSSTSAGSPATPPPREKPRTEAHDGSIVVQSADGLAVKDVDGKSDPYVVLRMGPRNTPFERKNSKTEQRGSAVASDTNPMFKLAFHYHVPSNFEPSDWELHIKLFDRDTLSVDDALGEVRVTVATLLTHRNALAPYTVQGPPSDAQGRVHIMAGDGVDKALFDEVAASIGAASSGIDALHVDDSLFGRISRFFAATFSDTLEYARIAQMGLAWNAPVRRQASSKMFLNWATRGGINTFVWDGPAGDRQVTINGHEEVAQRLRALGRQFGSSNANGAVHRENRLGWVPLNNSLWPETP